MSKLIDLSKYHDFFKTESRNWKIFRFNHDEKLPYTVILPNNEYLHVSNVLKLNLIENNSPFVCSTAIKMSTPENMYSLKVDMPCEIPIIDYIRFIFMLSFGDNPIIFETLEEESQYNIIYLSSAYAPNYTKLLLRLLFIKIRKQLTSPIDLDDELLNSRYYPSYLYSLNENSIVFLSNLVNLIYLEMSFGFDDILKNNYYIRKLVSFFVYNHPHDLYLKLGSAIDIKLLCKVLGFDEQESICNAYIGGYLKYLKLIQDHNLHIEIPSFGVREMISDVAKNIGIDIEEKNLEECISFVASRYRKYKYDIKKRQSVIIIYLREDFDLITDGIKDYLESKNIIINFHTSGIFNLLEVNKS